VLENQDGEVGVMLLFARQAMAEPAVLRASLLEYLSSKRCTLASLKGKLQAHVLGVIS